MTEYNASGKVLRRYVHGPGTDEPLVWYEGPGTTTRRWLHADERGSIVAVSDASGAKYAINSYDEYGVPGAANVGRFQYTGQAYIPEIGMYDYKARIYAPTIGRFMQTDPIGYQAGPNLYGYVGGDPVNATDPSGLATESPCRGPNPAVCGLTSAPGDDGEIIVTSPCPRGFVGNSVTGCFNLNIFGAEIALRASNGPQELSGSEYAYPLPDFSDPKPQKPKTTKLPCFNISLSGGASVFLGKGAGFEVGASYNYDTGGITLFATARSGYGLGLTGGAGLNFSNSAPASGLSQSYNGGLGLGPIGASVSTPGSIGSGISLGPDIGAEVSKTTNLTATSNVRGGNRTCSGS